MPQRTVVLKASLKLGRLLLSHRFGLHMLNGTPTCTGYATRVVERTDGTQTSTTIDYILVSQSLLPHVRSMTIVDDRMGSDHYPIVLS